MLPDGPTTTTVAPPFGLAALENATHASASLRAVSRLISCRCARLVASGDIVTSASFAGGVCADATALASATIPATSTRFIDLHPLRCHGQLPRRRRHPHRRHVPGLSASAGPGRRQRV